MKKNEKNELAYLAGYSPPSVVLRELSPIVSLLRGLLCYLFLVISFIISILTDKISLFIIGIVAYIVSMIDLKYGLYHLVFCIPPEKATDISVGTMVFVLILMWSYAWYMTARIKADIERNRLNY